MEDTEVSLNHVLVRVGEKIRQLAPGKIDCADGCSYCCQCLAVSVNSLTEARVALREAERTYRPKEFRALKENIHSQFQRSKNVTTVEEFRQLKMACPFLVNDSCSIYNARPISCRTCVSNDKLVCMSGLGPPACVLSADQELKDYMHAINEFRNELIKESDFGDCALEFRAALVYVLEGRDPAGNLPYDALHAGHPAVQELLDRKPGTSSGN